MSLEWTAKRGVLDILKLGVCNTPLRGAIKIIRSVHMDYTTRTLKTGKKVITVGKVEKHYDKEAKAYDVLYEQGFSITGISYAVNARGETYKIINLRVSNVYLMALKGKNGDVHYTTKEAKCNGISANTAKFKVNQKAGGFKNAKQYLLDAFGTSLTWEAFDEIATKVYGTQLEKAKQEREQKEKESAAAKERLKDILSHTAI